MEGATPLLSVPGRASLCPCSLTSPTGGCLVGRGGREAGRGRRPSWNCGGAILLGREIKRNIKRSPRVYREEPGGLNSVPAGRGDEKADSRLPQVLETSCSSALPSPGSGAGGCLWGCNGRPALFFRRGKDTPRSLWFPPHAVSHALFLVTEVLQPPAEGGRTAPALSAAARRGCSPSTPPNLVPCC